MQIIIKNSLLIFLSLSGLVAEEKPTIVQGHVFAWPFLESQEMQPRGGTTRGAEVTLDPISSEAFHAIRAKGITKQERDRRAILALAGSYRVSFDFTEIMGFSEDYSPPKPYFSWGTEHIHVLSNESDFVSLQHTLVMYFENPETKEKQEMIMKHWRQDWRFEDNDLHVYVGNRTWKRETISKAKGKWSQAVYQVDDSPRYETVGHWKHLGGRSSWKSENTWRPLPRREFSIRSDYNILSGVHEITLTPTGWVHVQQNQKLHLETSGRQKIVGQEIGLNRYERISSPSLQPALKTWEKTGRYWAEVRAKWAEVYSSKESFTLLTEVDDQKLYQVHFGYAADVENQGYDKKAGREHARATIEKFLAPPKSSDSENY